MFKSFTTKQLIFLTLVGVILFVTDFAVSGIIDTATGIPGAGWMVSSIYWFAIAVVGAITVKKFGSATIMAFIYSVLATPLPLMGPPGAWKLILGIGVGLTVDLIALIFRYKKVAYYIAPVIASILSIFGLLWLLQAFGLPGVADIKKALLMMQIISGVESLIGAWIGIKVYNKIKEKSFVKQLTY